MHIRKVVVVRVFRERCRNRVFARVRVARFFVVRNGHAVGERSRNSKRFFRAVVGVFRTRKGYARYRCFVDSERCRLVGDCVVIRAIAREFCRYRVRIGVDFSVILPIHGNTVRQARCRYEMRLPVIGRFGIFKANTRHIVGCLVDSERCRKFNGVVVCKGNRCFNGVFTCICVARCLIVRHLRARRQTCNGKRFCRSVIGRCHVVKDQPCEVVIFERYRPRAGHAFIAHRQSVRADGGKLGVIFRRKVVGGQCCRFRGIVAIRCRDGVVRIVKFVDKDFRFTRNADTFQRGRRGRFFLTASRKECREQTQAKPK